MNNTALAVRTDTMDDWQVLTQQAAMLVKTNFLPQAIKTPEQAVAIIMTGRELGIGTMQALNTINVIAGKPTISPQLMLALINRTGQLEDISITDDGQACTVRMKRRGRTEHAETFSMKDAALMKTTDGYGENKKTISLSEKYNWRQMPGVMRKWRAVAACARVVFPDVILGLYTHEEMGAAVEPESGELIEAATVGAIPEPPDDPPIHLDAADAGQNEPEPQPTKRDGKQQQSGNGTVRAIMSLADFLGWDGKTLANEVYEHPQLRVSISEQDPARSLETMDKLQLKTLLQALQAEKKLREANND